MTGGSFDPYKFVGGESDSAQLQAELDQLASSGGGEYRLNPARRYRLSVPLVIPYGVMLTGPGAIGQGFTPRTGWQVSSIHAPPKEVGGALWVCFATDASADYRSRDAAIRVRGSIKGCSIFQRCYDVNLTSEPTDWASASTVDGAGVFCGTAIRQDACDAYIGYCFVGGFFQAIHSYYVERGTYEHLKIDCINGIEIASSTDVHRIASVHAFPFAASSGIGSCRRRGNFLYFHDRCDWTQVSQSFCYGFNCGYSLCNVGGVKLDHCSADNVGGVELGTTAGFYLQDCEKVSLVGCIVAAHQYGIYANAGRNNSITASACDLDQNTIGYHKSSGALTIMGGSVTGSEVGIRNATPDPVRTFGMHFSVNKTQSIGPVSIY